MMAKMAAIGLIEVAGRTIRLLDRGALEDLARTGKLMGTDG
jgi:hypothetical protein